MNKHEPSANTSDFCPGKNKSPVLNTSNELCSENKHHESESVTSETKSMIDSQNIQMLFVDLVAGP